MATFINSGMGDLQNALQLLLQTNRFRNQKAHSLIQAGQSTGNRDMINKGLDMLGQEELGQPTLAPSSGIQKLQEVASQDPNTAWANTQAQGDALEQMLKTRGYIQPTDSKGKIIGKAAYQSEASDMPEKRSYESFMKEIPSEATRNTAYADTVRADIQKGQEISGAKGMLGNVLELDKYEGKIKGKDYQEQTKTLYDMYWKDIQKANDPNEANDIRKRYFDIQTQLEKGFDRNLRQAGDLYGYQKVSKGGFGGGMKMEDYRVKFTDGTEALVKSTDPQSLYKMYGNKVKDITREGTSTSTQRENAALARAKDEYRATSAFNTMSLDEQKKSVNAVNKILKPGGTQYKLRKMTEEESSIWPWKADQKFVLVDKDGNEIQGGAVDIPQPQGGGFKGLKFR